MNEAARKRRERLERAETGLARAQSALLRVRDEVAEVRRTKKFDHRVFEQIVEEGL